MVYPRIDPKTRKLIVADLTPSIRAVLDDANDYADVIAFEIKRLNSTLEIQQKTLEAILLCLSSMSGININKEDL